MLIHKIENTHFSESESIIIDYLLKKGEEIKDMTISQISQQTYTSPSLLIRISKKLGYNGFNEFKAAYIKELEYMYAKREIDASIPFTINDNMMTIAHNIIQLEKETLDDTLSLLNHDDLQKALQLLRICNEIDIYGVSSNVYLAETFKQNMNRIQKRVNLCYTTGSTQVQAIMSTPKKCAILISYSGRTPFIIDVAKKLKEKKTPIIALTNIAENELSSLADVTLRISSRELINTKIGDFASTQSVKSLLDILYSCLFSLDYKKNLDYRIQVGKEITETQMNV